MVFVILVLLHVCIYCIIGLFCFVMLVCWILLSFPVPLLMRTVAGGWFISFTRVACCPFG